MIEAPSVPEPVLQARRVEWPTLLLTAAIYGAWLFLCLHHAAIPLPLLAIAGGIVVAWQSSLQHETIHGHPTGVRWIDGAIGFPPLMLWLPYAVYRRSHLAHHRSAITDPLDDPESNYHARSHGLGYRLARIQATLTGRMILGPPIRIAAFLIAEARRVGRSPAGMVRDWLPHLAGVAVLLWWLDRIDLPITTYLAAFVYPGTALSLLRSFAEHRADRDEARCAAIVARPGPLGLLFLNNNLHAVHHARPGIAWYRLPAYHRRHAQAFAKAPQYRSYGEIVRRFAVHAQDDVVHPAYRTDAASAAADMAARAA